MRSRINDVALIMFRSLCAVRSWEVALHIKTAVWTDSELLWWNVAVDRSYVKPVPVPIWQLRACGVNCIFTSSLRVVDCPFVSPFELYLSAYTCKYKNFHAQWIPDISCGKVGQLQPTRGPRNSLSTRLRAAFVYISRRGIKLIGTPLFRNGKLR